MTKTLIPLMTLALIGCFGDDTGKDDTAMDDTDTDTTMIYETEIDAVSYGYDSAEWTYEVDVIGWAESAHMYITQDTSSPWEEDHDLVQGDYDPDGAWDTWGITLPITGDWSAQESGVNTLFSGDAAMESTMVWRIDVYDAGTIADCVYWAGSSADVSIIADSDCRELTF
jgi:hypothetical protein